MTTTKRGTGESGRPVTMRERDTDFLFLRSTRLVGLAALTGVVTSEALYHSSAQLREQVAAFIPALILPLIEVEVSTLDHE